MADVISFVHNMMTSADHDRLNSAICERLTFASVIVQNDTHKGIIRLLDGNIKYQLLSFADGTWMQANYMPHLDDIIDDLIDRDR